MSTGVDMKHVTMTTKVSKKIGKVIRSGVKSTELAIQRKTEAPADKQIIQLIQNILRSNPACHVYA